MTRLVLPFIFPQFWSDGLLAVDDFLTPDEVSCMRSSMLRLVEGMDPKEHRGVFSTTSHNQVCLGEKVLHEKK